MMKTKSVYLLLRFGLSVIIGLTTFSSCSNDDNAARRKGMHITVRQENFGAATRSDVPHILHQETINLGDGIYMNVTLQEDFDSDNQDSKTRTEGTPLPDGTYTILGYYADGRFAGSNVGTVQDEQFIASESDDFKFHAGNYNFVCVSNVELAQDYKSAFVSRGQASDNPELNRVALISDPETGEIIDGDIKLSFIMRHKESGIRFVLKSTNGGFENVSGVISTVDAETKKPSKHQWSLPTASTYTEVESTPIGNIVVSVPQGETRVESPYAYFLPGTDATDITFTFSAGTVWGKSLANRAIRLTGFQEVLQANTRYTATISFSDGLPAFDGIIAIDSNGKLTLTGGSDKAARTVFFKGGGVVASTSRSSEWKESEIVYDPMTTSVATWDALPYAPSSTNVDDAYHTYDNVIRGMGDPCRLVGLDEITSTNYDNGMWRLPTQAEYNKATYGNWITAEASAYSGNGNTNYAGYIVSINGSEVFQPAVGVRNSSGVWENSNISSKYWTGTNTGSSNLANLSISSSKKDTEGTNPSNGAFPIRCVRQEVKGDGVPAFKGIIAVGDDGQLTLTGDNDPTAQTVYFKYGSVVAISSRNVDWSSDEIMYNPSTKPNTDCVNWDDVPFVADGSIVSHTWGDVQQGKGDPCRLIGITPTADKFDNGLWCLPSKAEYGTATLTTAPWAATGNQGNGTVDYPGREIKLVRETKFQPAAGYRTYNEGKVSDQKTLGLYWTVEGFNPFGYCINFNSASVISNDLHQPMEAMPIRCVPQEIPAFNGIIAIDNEGVLTLDGESDPNARTLYFKRGSVVGTRSRTNLGETSWAGASDVVYNPSATNTFSNWEDLPAFLRTQQGFISYSYIFPDELASGFGDACRLIGLSKTQIESGVRSSWRSPNDGEYSSTAPTWVSSGLKGNSANDFYPGAYFTINGVSIFQPAAGARNRTTGNVNVVKTTIGAWINGGTRTRLEYKNSGTNYSVGNYSNSNSNTYHTAYPIRCVAQ